ncbi:ABC transporter ATP-binding protein [Candidatus Bathyarchaeota archaeon]|nr:MAG: ABC transporter ATP-binding protein [Candidatus Bathyarchaeota archaeon]
MKFAYLQTFFIAFLLFWIIFAYEIDSNSRLGFDAQLPYNLSQTTLITIITAGLVLSIGFLTANYRENRKRLAVARMLPQQAPVQPPQLQTPKPGMLRRVLSDLRPYSRSIVIAWIISLSTIPITLITPLPIKLLVDSVIGSQPLPGYLTVLPQLASRDYVLYLAIGILLGSAVLAYLQNLVSTWYLNKAGNRMTLDVRARLFRQMQRLSIAYHDSKGTLDSAYRTLNDAPALRSFGIDSIIPLFTSVLTLAAMIVVTLYVPTHPRLPAANPQRMEEVQDLRKRGNGGSPRIPWSLTRGESLRARGTEKQTTSLPLQRQSFRATQSLRGQRRLQPARRRRHIDRASRCTVRGHPTRPGEHSKPRSAIGRQLLCDTALFSPEKRWTEDPRHTIIARGNRKVPRGPRRDT